MKIHTDVHTIESIQAAFAKIPHSAVTITEHRSRKRKRRFDVHPCSTAAWGAIKGRRSSGTAVHAGKQGLSWDEWGIALNALFRDDGDMIAGQYSGYGDFLYSTDWRFTDLTWEDRCHHPRWDFLAPREFECPECGTVKRYQTAGFTA